MLLVSHVGPNLLHLIITLISPFLIYLSRFCHPRSILHPIRVLPSYTLIQAAFGRKVYDGTNELISYQTVDSSSKPASISPEALRKEH